MEKLFFGRNLGIYVYTYVCVYVYIYIYLYNHGKIKCNVNCVVMEQVKHLIYDLRTFKNMIYKNMVWQA